MAECRSRVPTGGESERFGKNYTGKYGSPCVHTDFD